LLGQRKKGQDLISTMNIIDRDCSSQAEGDCFLWIPTSGKASNSGPEAMANAVLLGYHQTTGPL